MKKLKLINKWVIIYLILSLFLGISISLFPISLKFIVRSIKLNTSIFIPLVVVCICAFFIAAVNIVNMFVKKKINISYEYEIKKRMLHHFENKDFNSFKTTELENHFIFDSSKIISNYMLAKIDFIYFFITTSIVIAAIAYLSLVMLPILIITNLLLIYSNKFLQVQSSKINVKYSENRKVYLNQINDLLIGYKDCSSLNASQNLKLVYSKIHNNYAILNKKLVPKTSMIEVLKNIFSTTISLTIWVSLSLLTSNEHIEISAIIIFIGVNTTFNSQINQLISSIYSIKSMKGLLEKVFQSIKKQSVKKVNNPFPITTNNLSFVSKNKILDFKDLSIYENDKILLKGRNGIGKSIFGKILLNLIQYNGSVLFNKNKINTYDISIFSNYISTNPMIFNGTISENILLRKNAYLSEELILKYNFLFRKLPEQSENALNLSHGQKQIINYIRALIMSPKLLIIDEGFSGIEEQIVKLIEKQLSSLKCAIIYISHQEKTFFQANKIINKGNRI